MRWPTRSWPSATSTGDAVRSMAPCILEPSAVGSGAARGASGDCPEHGAFRAALVATDNVQSAVSLSGAAQAQRRLLDITLRHELGLDHGSCRAVTRDELPRVLVQRRD